MYDLSGNACFIKQGKDFVFKYHPVLNTLIKAQDLGKHTKLFCKSILSAAGKLYASRWHSKNEITVLYRTGLGLEGIQA
jgi:hypothetical protein